MDKEKSVDERLTTSPSLEEMETAAPGFKKEGQIELTEEVEPVGMSKGDSTSIVQASGKGDTCSDLEPELEGEKSCKTITRNDLEKTEGRTSLESKCEKEEVNTQIKEGEGDVESKCEKEEVNTQIKEGEGDVESKCDKEEVNTQIKEGEGDVESKCEKEEVNTQIKEGEGDVESKCEKEEVNTQIKEGEGDVESVSGRAEVLEMVADRSMPSSSLDADQEAERSAWPEKGGSFKNFVKGVVAVTSFLRVLSGKRQDVGSFPPDEEVDWSSAEDREAVETSQNAVPRSSWNPLNFIMVSRDDDSENKHQLAESVVFPQSIVMKGRVMLYTRLQCQNCKEVRLFLLRKKLAYVEVNIDLYPGRKMELEKFTGSSAVPMVFFNEVVIGGLSELKDLDETGKLQEKIDFLITEAPASEAPLPPLSGEDDMSSSGSIDELALIARKMKACIIIKDRFYKMRRFTNCFLGMDAVDFLSEDQYLEREEAVEFGRKMATKLFFRHVLDENLFEDGNHFYRFLDDDPLVSSQCHNIPLGISVAKPKPVKEIASRLRLLSCAIFEAYTSEDGKHVDYRTLHGSEEFARYMRIIQELQRVELQDMPREEKLAFFINLYNMMAIHAILVMGYPLGALERRKLFGDFKYVLGGCTYSLSAIQNGILRGNQRPPYTLKKPFSIKDKHFGVTLPYAEPLVHFALVYGTRSGPALRCYSPGNIDKELVEAAHKFLRGGGLIVDPKAAVAYANKILKWYSVDFGKNETEVLKHVSNYLEPTDATALLDLLARSQLKVIYQPYDWGLNY